MIRRAARRLRLDPPEAKSAEIKLIDKHVDHANRIVFGDKILQPVWKQRGLATINALDKTLHQKPPQLTTAGF